jgi:cytochrome c biogenesis protein CcdA
MPPIPILIGAAVIDSINPCAFGVLIFLLAYLTKTAKNKHTLLVHGLTYIGAVFLTYLIAGLLLMPLIGNLGKFSVTVYAIIGIIVIIAGLLELKDYFWYGKGFSLELLPGSSKRIKMYAENITGSIWSAFSLGVFVAIVELPCTGAVYIAILSMMSLSGVSAMTITLLIVYNILFVLPLVVILLMFYRGTNADSLEKLRRKYRKYMRLIIGLMLLLLGGWMLHTALY